MTKPTSCEVDTCDRTVFVKRLCRAHYDRLAKFGDVRADVPLRKLPTRAERSDIEARILARCGPPTSTGCIEWSGYTLPDSGYGTIGWQGRDWVVHRAMWTVKVGPIPTDDDWTIDHLCFNRRCVNIKHLEVVTRTENSRRGGGLLRAQSLNQARSNEACKNGHARTEHNTRIDRRGYQSCLDCKRATWRRREAEVNEARRLHYAERRAQGFGWREARLGSPV